MSEDTKKLIKDNWFTIWPLLEQAYDAGFSDGFWTEDNPADPMPSWEAFVDKIRLICFPPKGKK